jgi:DNA uptake protein ComE-like DNA-binding protein
VSFFVKANPFDTSPKVSVNMLAESKLDSIKKLVHQKDSKKIFPFNPNYITDYKGYTLGMSPGELDRLFAYRKQKRFVNSAESFQKVTKVSDSLLKTIAPYFKFPEWTQKNRQIPVHNNSKSQFKEKEVDKVKDLNLATIDDFKTIRGIGDKLSARIVKFRDRLGGFVINKQLNDVYGLKPDVVKRVLSNFKVVQPPKIEKININTATAKELSRLVYINYDLAKEIVAFREVNGAYGKVDELVGVKTFPVERIDRIKLYLTL